MGILSELCRSETPSSSLAAASPPPHPSQSSCVRAASRPPLPPPHSLILQEAKEAEEGRKEDSIPFFLSFSLFSLEFGNEGRVEEALKESCLDCEFWCGGQEESIRDYLGHLPLFPHCLEVSLR